MTALLLALFATCPSLTLDFVGPVIVEPGCVLTAPALLVVERAEDYRADAASEYMLRGRVDAAERVAVAARELLDESSARQSRAIERLGRVAESEARAAYARGRADGLARAAPSVVERLVWLVGGVAVGFTLGAITGVVWAVTR